MLELSKAFVYFFIQQTAVVIFSLVRSKALAAICGVGGYGLISQASTLVLTLTVVMGSGLGSGFVKLIAENSEDSSFKQRSQIVVTLFTLGTLTGMAGILVTTLFSKTISVWIFGSSIYAGYVLICALTSFFVFQYLFILNLFRGLLEWKIFTLVSIVSTGASLVVTLLLIFLFSIEGGVWALLVSQICSLMVAVSFYYFKIRRRHSILIFGEKFTRHSVVLLINHIGPLMIIQIVISLSGLVTRSLVIQRLGLDQNGFVQLSTGISDAYMGLILALLMSYILPKIAVSAIKDPAAAHQTQNDSLRFSILIITPFMVALLASREIWIPILYSRAFLAAQGILLWQFLGDFFLVIRRCLNIDLVPTNRLRYFVLDGALFAIGTILITAVLLPFLGILAVMIGGLIINVTLTLVSMAYHLRRTTFRLSPLNWVLLAKAFGLLCIGFMASVWIPNLLGRAAVVSVILGLMLMALPKKGELKTIWRTLLPSMVQQGRAAFRSTSSPQTDDHSKG